MELDDRKKRILEAIVETYITTAEPVGSRTLARSSPLSPATIRNEMSDLEELGLLEQPHTSAGRIPSDRGYRFYVDQLMRKYELTTREVETLRGLMQIRISEADSLIKEIAGIYAHLTKYTIFAVTPQKKQSYIKHLQLMPIDHNIILLALVTNKNIVKTKQIALPELVSADLLSQLTEALNRYISGRREDNITPHELETLRCELGGHAEILKPILNFIARSINELDDAEIFLHGTTNFLGFPEYRDVEKAREILEFLEDRSNITKIFTTEDGGPAPLTVRIGHENEPDEIKSCSLISSRYGVGENRGAIGIIGPTRMNYARAVSMLEYFVQQINKNLEDDE